MNGQAQIKKIYDNLWQNANIQITVGGLNDAVANTSSDYVT